jgi:hypothetical protein
MAYPSRSDKPVMSGLPGQAVRGGARLMEESGEALFSRGNMATGGGAGRDRSLGCWRAGR